jgi:hypothetical protein
MPGQAWSCLVCWYTSVIPAKADLEGSEFKANLGVKARPSLVEE